MTWYPSDIEKKNDASEISYSSYEVYKDFN